MTWFNFIKRTRVKWPTGIMPESYAEPDTEKVEGTEGLYRKPNHQRSTEVAKPAKKAAPMPPKKGGKGKKDKC